MGGPDPRCGLACDCGMRIQLLLEFDCLHIRIKHHEYDRDLDQRERRCPAVRGVKPAAVGGPGHEEPVVESIVERLRSSDRQRGDRVVLPGERGQEREDQRNTTQLKNAVNTFESTMTSLPSKGLSLSADVTQAKAAIVPVENAAKNLVPNCSGTSTTGS